MKEQWSEPTLTMLEIANTEYGDPGPDGDGGVWDLKTPKGTKTLPAGPGS